MPQPKYDEIGCQICGEEKPSTIQNWTQGGIPHMLNGWLACKKCSAKYAKTGKPENFENWPIEEINDQMIREYYTNYFTPDEDKWDEFTVYWSSREK